MKRFKDLKEEILSEGGEMYPADEMTMKEIKIACYAARNILERLEDGAMIQRWQISAIVKASDELASVYTSMSADEGMEDDEDDMDYEMGYDEYGYPSMYGEETELDEKLASHIIRGDNYAGVPDRIVAQAKDKVKKMNISNASEHKKAMYKALSDLGWEMTIGGKYVKEDMDYAVDIEGLPKMYVKGKSPMDVKAILRKVIKKPDMIQNVERTTKAELRKAFMLKAQGKDELEEGYNDPIHREYVSDAVHRFVPKDDPKHDKIVDHLHKAKNYGSKTYDSLETEAGISIGSAIRITKAVADHMKTNFGSPNKTQTQAQRIDKYLKQKWVKK
jgi:hypothetical protein